jgi:hypothetical protein
MSRVLQGATLGQAPALPVICGGDGVTNALAYQYKKLITTIKFIVPAPGNCR